MANSADSLHRAPQQHGADAEQAGCFHCGEPLPAPEARFHARIDGIQRTLCCAGCAAVAELIAGQGLDEFYRFRDGPAPTPESVPADEWLVYDRPAAQADFTQTLDEHRREAVFLLEGLYCAACAWLVERVLGPIAGVEAIEVNPATGRALLRWDARRVDLSTLLRRIDAAGYRPHPVNSNAGHEAARRERNQALRRLAVGGLGMMQVMMYAIGLYAGAIHADMAPALARLLEGVSLLVATPVVLYAGAPFFRGAGRDLRAGRPGMDVPIALAIGGAFAASVWNTLIGSGEVYFDSVTMFVFFLSVTRFLELLARQRATRQTDALARMLPAGALRIGPHGEERVATRELAVGDRVRVAAGEPVPADGRVVDGTSRLDESLLTGEASPIERGPGSEVTGGSVNLDGPLDIEIRRIGADTAVAAIGRLLERAQSERPPVARIADRVARWFVVGVLLAAAATALYWGRVAPGEAFSITLAVLVVTCPCALALATPSALIAAGQRLLAGGMLVTRARAIEQLARADHVVFDKTGTLTQGQPVVQATETGEGMAADEALAIAAALEAHSEHPIARAFAPWRDGRTALDVRVERGHGIEGRIDGQHYRLGRGDWVGGEAVTDSGDGDTRIALANEHGTLARFALIDPPRPGVPAMLSRLRQLGLGVEVLSGDAAGPVRTLCDSLGIEHWHARQTPDAKLERLRALQARGHRVLMLGDGINDAPVLAGADVSVAMGTGSALAQTSADMVLTGQRPGDLADAIVHARRTLRIIRQNIVWAVGYNTLGLPLAAAGLVAPWMAALGMSASSLLVVGNALRLGRTPRARAGGGNTAAPAASGAT